VISNEVFESIKYANSIAIGIHTSPDGDAIGSSLALGNILLRLGKKVDLYCHDTIPDAYDFLLYGKEFNKTIDQEHWYDLFIALDCSDLERLGPLSILVKFATKTINIDHHLTNSHFGDINLVNVSAGATAEIIYEIFNSLGLTLDQETAESLYTGIVTDTGNFNYSNVTPNTHYIAAELLKAGVIPEKISVNVFKNHSLNKIKLWGKAINAIETDFNGKFAMIAITSEMMNDNGAKEFDVEGIINFALDIKDVELAVLIRETNSGTVKASFRSKNYIDVSSFAAQFGGGGHKKAAGSLMKDGIEQSKHKIKSAAYTLLNNTQN